jgi:hypothetical protein
MADPLLAKESGVESSLSTWAGPYVTDMLGRGAALGKKPYVGYQGPLTAGQSDLQTQGFQGIAGLSMPTAQMGAYTPQSYTDTGVAQQYMNPYLSAVLEPQIAEAQRVADIERTKNASRMTQAGSYGGSRQAILESEGQRNLLRNLADITGTGYAQAYGAGESQFNIEQDRQRAAQGDTNRYGLDALRQMADFGAEQREIEAQGITADREQFEDERDYPYRNVQFLQSLLQGLPVGSKSITYNEESPFSQGVQSAGGIIELLKTLGVVG